MPSIYQGRCSACGYETPARLSDKSAVITETGELKVLAHPLESRQLAAMRLRSGDEKPLKRLQSVAGFNSPY